MTTKEHGLGVRGAALYASVFLSFGVHLPFFPVWLAGRGLSAAEIAAVIATPQLVRMASTPFLGALADRAGDRRAALVLAAALALVLMIPFAWVDGFWPILILAMVLSVPWGACLPTVDAIVTTLVREHGIDFGRVRLWGSVSFIASSVGSGLVVARFGAEAVYPLLVLALAVQLVVAVVVTPRAPVAARSEPPASGGLLAGLGEVLRLPGIVAVLVGASLVNGAHALLYAFGTLHFAAIGFDKATIGVLWAIGVVSEIALFWVSTRFMARLGPIGFLIVGGVAAVVRFAVFPYQHGLAMAVALQLVHALSFGAMYMGMMHAVTRLAPTRLAGVTQALVTSTNAVFMATLTYLSGPLYAALGGQGFLVMSAVAALGTAIVVARFLTAGQPQSDGSGGWTRDPS